MKKSVSSLYKDIMTLGQRVDNPHRVTSEQVDTYSTQYIKELFKNKIAQNVLPISAFARMNEVQSNIIKWSGDSLTMNFINQFDYPTLILAGQSFRLTNTLTFVNKFNKTPIDGGILYLWVEMKSGQPNFFWGTETDIIPITNFTIPIVKIRNTMYEVLIKYNYLWIDGYAFVISKEDELAFEVPASIGSYFGPGTHRNAIWSKEL